MSRAIARVLHAIHQRRAVRLAAEEAAEDALYLTPGEPPFVIPDECPVCQHEWRCVCARNEAAKLNQSNNND